MEALRRAVSNLERVRNDFENASTAVDNALAGVQVDVLDANMQVARHRATAAMGERKRRRLLVGAGAGAPPPPLPLQVGPLIDRDYQTGIDDAVLDAQEQVQDMLRAMARVHNHARELASRVREFIVGQHDGNGTPRLST